MPRLTQTLTIRRFSRVKDGPYTVSAPLEDWPVDDWPVWGVAPGTPEEPFESGREPVGELVTVYAPVEGPHPGAKDVVALNNELWQVDGGTAVWDNNPTVAVTRHRGVVVVLRRWEG